MVKKYRNFKNLNSRPKKNLRLFQSKLIESVIKETSAQIKDPDIQRMFKQCLPNTLDTTVYYREYKDDLPDTYVVTGDIPAMWLRDSTNQIWPYLRFANQDRSIQNLFLGLIHRQTQSILLDPYANAFVDKDIAGNEKGFWDNKKPWYQQILPWKKEKRLWEKGVWERKYELDSLGAFFRISSGYYEATGDTTPFNTNWINAIRNALSVIEKEQQTLNKTTANSMYHFFTPDGQPFPSVRMDGYGYPGKSCGLVRNVFRPSDDESALPYLIPANAMVVVALRGVVKILHKLNNITLAEEVSATANKIDRGIQKIGIVDHKEFGQVFAYEVDGFGSHHLMDDPNIPSLLSLPYLGYCSIKDPVYTATRKMILNQRNPFYAVGSVAHGLTSPHTGVVDHFWPMATIMQAFTTEDEKEIISSLKTLKNTHANTYFMHESVHVDNPKYYTRPWFGWVNSLFGELILELSNKHPKILKQRF